jgi:hypothetical protein
MSPINSNDVKSHLSTRDRNGRRLHAVPTVADATGFSSEESGNAEAGRGTETSLEQAEAPGRPVLAPVLVAATSKREQA